jgi:outer membrane protein TolC
LGVTESRRQIAIATAQAYLAVIAARRQVEVDVRAIGAARAHLDYAQRRLDGGAGTRLNQLRAAQQVTGDEARLEGTRLSLRRAQESLGVLLAENEPVDAGAEPSFDAPANISEEDWALARPDLARQAATIKAAERVLNDSRKDWLPRASLSFTPQVVTSSSLLSPSRTWQVVASVSQQVFNPSQRAVNALRQVSLNQTKLGRTIIEIQARAEVRLAQASVESVQRSLTSARLAAQQANEVLQITTSAFELGATTNIEVIDAQRSARDAESTATVVEDLLRRVRLDLLVAIGRFPR